MKIKLFSLLILLFIVVSNPSFAADKSFTDMSIAELKDHATSTHPAGLYVLTAKLLKEDKKNEAVFWFYVAQLRFRFYLAANPDLEKSGDPALFSS